MLVSRSLRSGLGTALVVVLTSVLSLDPGNASAELPDPDFKLRPGQPQFWGPVDVDSAQVPDPALCGTAGPCWNYGIKVTEAGRLRVALSSVFQDPGDVHPWPDPQVVGSEMIFDLQLLYPDGNPVLDPNGNPVKGSTGTPTSSYAVEVFVEAPSEVTYTARVIPRSVTDMAFRMRAKLEKESGGAGQGLLSLNLREIPPFEFNFYLPTSTFGHGVGTPDPAHSCEAEEIAEAIEQGWGDPGICLRYSMGLENAGEGRFDLVVKPPGVCPPDGSPCEVHQRRWNADGTPQPETEWNSAGSVAFHPTHAHFHYENAYEIQLLKVEEGWKPGDPPPNPPNFQGNGRKLGFDPTNERMADWRRFWPACGLESSELTAKCQHDRDYRSDAFITIQAGWGDIYDWNRGGNYVAFPDDPPGSKIPDDGYYVLGARADPEGKIIETDETDNVSYALIKVSENGQVDLIERGYGSDPWDPSKKVLKVTP